MNGRNKWKLCGKIYGASRKQVASLEAGKPTMLKTYLLPSSLAPATAPFYHRASSCGGCQRSTCSGACIRKISPHVNYVSQISSARPPRTKAAISPEWNGLSVPNLNEHGESINTAESSEISKTFEMVVSFVEMIVFSVEMMHSPSKSP